MSNSGRDVKVGLRDPFGETSKLPVVLWTGQRRRERGILQEE